MSLVFVAISIFLTVFAFLGSIYLIWIYKRDRDEVDHPAPNPVPTVSFTFNRTSNLTDPYTYENNIPAAWPRSNPAKPVTPVFPVYPINSEYNEMYPSPTLSAPTAPQPPDLFNSDNVLIPPNSQVHNINKIGDQHIF